MARKGRSELSGLANEKLPTNNAKLIRSKDHRDYLNEHRDSFFNWKDDEIVGQDFWYDKLQGITLEEKLNSLEKKVGITTSGRLLTTNRNGGQLQDDFRYNVVYVLPPAGYTASDVESVIVSIGNVWYGGSRVDDNDNIWSNYKINTQENRIEFICNNTENRDNSTINYLIVWKKK